MKTERTGRQDAQLERILPKWFSGRANPEGWQMVAGGRSPLALNDHRKAGSGGRAPWRGARPSPNSYCLVRSGRLLNDESGTPAGVQDICCVVIRRSPPPNPRRPPATFLQPFGLTDPECPNSTSRRTARPSNERAIWATRPALAARHSRISWLAATRGLACPSTPIKA
jgi:hypothetical protein